MCWSRETPKTCGAGGASTHVNTGVDVVEAEKCKAQSDCDRGQIVKAGQSTSQTVGLVLACCGWYLPKVVQQRSPADRVVGAQGPVMQAGSSVTQDLLKQASERRFSSVSGLESPC